MNEKELDPNEIEAQAVVKQFDACTDYKASKGILEDARRSVDFYEGRQFVDFKKLKLPFERAAMNVIQNMVDSKAASILNKTWKIEYTVNNNNASSRAINKFTEWQQEQLNQEELNSSATYDGLNKGSWIIYLYWDEDAQGQMGTREGAVKATMVDINDFAVSNPNDKDVQNQEYVIIKTRESVRKIKELCDTYTDEKIKDLKIKPSNYTSNYTEDVEQKNEEMADVYIKFFRQDGEVYYQKSTKEVLFQKPRSTNPFTVAKAMKKKKDDENNNGEKFNDNTGVYENEPVNNAMYTSEPNKVEDTKYKAYLYPIVIGSFIRRDKCMFGVSFTAQLIAPQKSINTLINTTLLTASKSAMPLIVVKQGALGAQKIDMSKPGQVITDMSPVGVDGIKAINLGTMNTAHYQLAQSLVSMMKDVYKTNDVLNDGRNTANGLSGYAMSLLSSIQDKPIAQWQQELARTVKAEGKILEQFYKLYYRNKKYTMTLTDAERMKAKELQLEQLRQQAQQQMDQGVNVDVTHLEDTIDVPYTTTGEFNGSDYLDTPFNVSVEVGEGTRYNETTLITLLDTLFLNGTIEKISPENLRMWVELIPKSVFPKKNELMLLIDRKEKSMYSVMEKQLQEALQMLQEAGIRMQQQQAQFEGVTAQYNDQLKKLKTEGQFNLQRARQTDQEVAKAKSDGGANKR